MRDTSGTNDDDTVHLPADATAVRLARRYVDDLLSRRGWGEPDWFAAQVAVSELVANAVVHAPGRITLRLRLDDELRIEVTDDHPVAPVHPASHRAGEVGGMGLRVVDRLCRDWGVDRREGAKTVWCRLAPHPAWSGGEGAATASR